MKRLKRALRLLGLILLIVFASVGLGIAGAVPIPKQSKKEDTIEVVIKDNETKEEDVVEMDELMLR